MAMNLVPFCLLHKMMYETSGDTRIRQRCSLSSGIQAPKRTTSTTNYLPCICNKIQRKSVGNGVFKMNVEMEMVRQAEKTTTTSNETSKRILGVRHNYMIDVINYSGAFSGGEEKKYASQLNKQEKES